MDSEFSTKRVLNTTGKTWDEWYVLIDEADEIALEKVVDFLVTTHGLNGYWAQLIAMRYRHRRKKSDDLTT